MNQISGLFLPEGVDAEGTPRCTTSFDRGIFPHLEVIAGIADHNTLLPVKIEVVDNAVNTFWIGFKVFNHVGADHLGKELVDFEAFQMMINRFR